MRNKLFNVINDVSILLAVWKRTGQRLNIGLVSPYSSQVDAIKSRLAKSMIHMMAFRSESSQLMVSKEKMTSSYYQL
jgi:hypothetical protein